ncbi:MAG: hypothetical protein WAX69_01620 [Victivallales bacterium]
MIVKNPLPQTLRPKMHLEVKRSFGIRNGRQRRGEALYLVSTGGDGGRCRKYIRKSDPGYSALLALSACRETLPPGRPAAYPEEVRAIFTACGYNVHGIRITMGKCYLLPSSSKARFEMLSDEDKIRIGSAATLLSFEKQAYSRLKKANVKGVPRTYRQCLCEAMSEALPPNPPPGIQSGQERTRHVQ